MEYFTRTTMRFIDIVNSYDLITTAERYGVRLHGASSKWGICPFPHHAHSKYTPSLSIYDGKDRQRFKCHGNCGASGDVIDFVGYMEINGYKPKNKRHSSQALVFLRGGMFIPKPPQRIAPKKRSFLPQLLYKKFFPLADNIRLYLHHRGLSDELIEKFNFGSTLTIENDLPFKAPGENERILSIPTFEAGTLMGIKLRIVGNGKYRYFAITGSKASFWGIDDIYHTTKPVLVAKGELCAAVMRQAGFLSTAPTGGEGQKKTFEHIKKALVLTKSIYIADNDTAGYKNGPIRAALLNSSLKFPPKRYVDWDEWYLAEPDKAIMETNRWIEELK